MPLELLLALVVGGIAGIVAVLHLLGLSHRKRLDSDAAARAAWLREFPEALPHHVTLCRDGHAALIATDRGEGIVWSMGADTTARWLTGASLTRTNQGLTVRLTDYTAPRIDLRLSEDETEAWAKELKETAA